MIDLIWLAVCWAWTILLLGGMASMIIAMAIFKDIDRGIYDEDK